MKNAFANPLALGVLSFTLVSTTALYLAAGPWALLLAPPGLGLAWWAGRREAGRDVSTSGGSDLAVGGGEREGVSEEFVALLEDTVVRVAELSSRQVEVSRGQTEEAISALSARFAAIVERLQAEESVSAGAADDAVGMAFTRSHAELESIADNLTRSLATRGEMLDNIRALAAQSEDLKAMAVSVGKIASQTNLLALNAAIEAARAGEMGRGFAVVADEVRALSRQSGETGQNIAEMVEKISAAMETTLESATALGEREAEVERQARSTIDEVLSNLKEIMEGLSHSRDRLKREGAGIRAEIEDILVSLQFQDRVSQILTHVGHSLGEFGAEVAEHKRARAEGRQRPIDAAKVFAELERGYTTSEQRAIHRGQSAHTVADDEIEYF